MQHDVQITIKDIPQSPAITDHVKRKAEKLDTFYDRIQSCRVVIDSPQRQKHQGKLYRARLDITIPGRELVISKQKNEDVYIAIRDAFAAATRILKKGGARQHGVQKSHAEILHGRISRIFVANGYGFIETAQDQEYYFDLACVSHPDFSHLAVGMTVQFIPTVGTQGLQANRVTHGKHGHNNWDHHH